MKRLLIALTAVAAVALSGCAGPITSGGKEYKPYGLANADAVKDPAVKYQLSFGSIVVAILFSETFFVPVYVVGWDLYQPVANKYLIPASAGVISGHSAAW
jgi:hypothetical protein